MSAHPTTSALLSLLPTYTTATLPPVLYETATGLLAQSRSRAAVLKPEEEVARGWACAEIAVRRLQTRLNLPAVFSNPPCPPRIYKKLYEFLNRTLVSHTVAPKTPPAPPVTPTKRKPAVVNRSAIAPTRPTTPASTKLQKNGKSQGSVKKRKLDELGSADGIAPEWLGSTVRHLCKKFSALAAVPHVFVGVVSLLKRQRTTSASPDIHEKSLPALVAAVLLVVLEKMRQYAEDEDTTGITNTASPRLAAQELVALGRVNVTGAGAVVAGIERFLEDHATAWRNMEWYTNIPNDSSKRDDDGDAEHGDDSNDLQQGSKIAPSVIRRRVAVASMPVYDASESHGLGATDWLSDARRRDYANWKVEILHKAQHIEHSQAREAIITL